MFTIRKAKISDAKQIKKIIDLYANKGLMLVRPIYEIYEDIRDFFVAEIDEEIVGCVAAHVFGKEHRPGAEEAILAEIRALAISENHQRKGIGRKLIEECIQDLKKLDVTKIFILSTKDSLDFFKKIGFKEVEKVELPQKIWQECIKCPRFPYECNEIALFLDIDNI